MRLPFVTSNLRIGVISAFVVLGFNSPVLADHHPYYFVGSGTSKHSLWTTSNCGHGISCVEFGHHCEADLYSSQGTLDVAYNMAQRGEKIYIRENQSPYDVVCTLVPN